jgi:hypothetical protein
VLVTVHGIGFEQPARIGGPPGYADALHTRLKEALHELGDDPKLGDDPNRPEGGPVYVRSEVNKSSREGLERLDEGRPLAPSASIAHVALVYTPSEPVKPRIGPVLQTLTRATLSLRHYATLPGFVKLLAEDGWAALRTLRSKQTSSLSPRVDATGPYGPRRGGLPFTRSPSLSEVVRALALDVATYVELNEARERVRGFVQAALLAVLDREDVDVIVINAHSQGTVVCWDVLCRLPFFTWQTDRDRRAQMLCQFVTAGSPIRKYIDLFAWGELVGQLAALLGEQVPTTTWSNFWDPRDPVGDPLDPAKAWRPGQDTGAGRVQDVGLLVGRDPAGGGSWHVKVRDVPVDNVKNSAGGGLQAHNYWDNGIEFVKPLAEILRGCSGEAAAPPTAPAIN